MEDSDWTVGSGYTPDGPDSSRPQLTDRLRPRDRSHILLHVENVLRTFVSGFKYKYKPTYMYRQPITRLIPKWPVPHRGGVLTSKLPSEKEQHLLEILLLPGRSLLKGDGAPIS